jgi:formylmethanofuran dehydrogenase subunit B
VPGIHSGGTILRSDGAALPLRPSLTSPLPSDHEWLSGLLGRLEELAR